MSFFNFVLFCFELFSKYVIICECCPLFNAGLELVSLTTLDILLP